MSTIPGRRDCAPSPQRVGVFPIRRRSSFQISSLSAAISGLTIVFFGNRLETSGIAKTFALPGETAFGKARVTRSDFPPAACRRNPSATRSQLHRRPDLFDRVVAGLLFAIRPHDAVGAQLPFTSTTLFESLRCTPSSANTQRNPPAETLLARIAFQ